MNIRLFEPTLSLNFVLGALSKEIQEKGLELRFGENLSENFKIHGNDESFRFVLLEVLETLLDINEKIKFLEISSGVFNINLKSEMERSIEYVLVNFPKTGISFYSNSRWDACGVIINSSLGVESKSENDVNSVYYQFKVVV